MEQNNKITVENYLHSYYQFQDRQSGISLVYSYTKKNYIYNVYCIEQTLLKEIFTVEYEFLDEALQTVNSEFGTWKLVTLKENEKTGCSSCSAH